MAEVGEPVTGQGIPVRLEEVEVALLLSLAAQMVDLLAPPADEDPLVALVGIDPDATVPEDPALQRLLPDAYSDDPEAAAQFRRFTERDLRESKVVNAREVAAELAEADGVVMVTEERLGAWLGFLNDTRLTIGSRLGITEENHAELAGLPDDDPRAGLFQVYDWLTFLQESLVQRALGDS
jgi:hypothetical protein